jgi:hypothetical protein
MGSQPVDQGGGLLQRRPAEVFSAGIGSATGAAFVIVGAFVPIPDQVPSATMILVSWVAALVTTWVEYRRRSTGPSG